MPDTETSTDKPSAWVRLLDSPLLGFAPWVVLSILEGPGRLELAAGIALALSIIFFVIDQLRGRSIKILGVIDIVSFTALLIVGALLSTDSRYWLETWFGEIANTVFVVVVAASMLARVPFTIQYAREQVPREHWDDPLFIRVNYIITGAWGIAFLVAAAAGLYGDAVLHNNSNLWTGWIIQIGASLVAAQFTEWYPQRATAQALLAARQPTEPPAPIAALLLPVVGYLVPVGIISLSIGGGPVWLGVGLIVVGVLLGRQLQQADESAKKAGEPAC